MTERVLPVVAVVTTVGCALMTGLLFAFSVSVMSALGRLPAAHGMSAMQSINVAILNPVFGLVFLVATVGSACLVVTSLFVPGRPGGVARLVGGALFLGGVVLVTMALNVPLNDALASIDPDAPDAALVWEHYLTRWTAWNHLRVGAGVVATTALLLSLRAG